MATLSLPLPDVHGLDTDMVGSLPVRTLRLPLRDPPLASGPNLREYDLVVIAISGGKDSLAALSATTRALALQACRAEIVVVHSDLGPVEWRGVTDLVRVHAREYDAGLEIVARQGREKTDGRDGVYQRGEVYGDLVDHALRNGFWPREDSRWCTSDHKRDQIRRCVTAHARRIRRERGLRRPVRVLNVVGMRAGEGRRRAEMKPFEKVVPRFSSKGRIVDVWLPIHAWTRNDVWRHIWRSGIRWHWAYDAGMPRLSCAFCILASTPAWRIAVVFRPELAARYAEAESVLDRTLAQGRSVGVVLSDYQGCSIVEYARRHGAERVATWED